MKTEIVYIRYATALLECLDGAKEIDAVQEQLESLEQTLKESEELCLLVADPFVALADKEGVLRAVGKKLKMGEKATNFVLTLLKNKRLDMLTKIVKRFEVVANAQLGREKVLVQAAAELGKVERNRLLERLKVVLGKEPVINYELNEELIGGFVIHAGNQIIDCSVAGRLQSIEEIVFKMRVR